MLEPVVIFVVFELLRRFFRWITNHKLTKSSYYEYVASTLIMLGPNIIFGSWAVIRKRSAFLTFWDKLFYAFYLKILLLYLIALFYYIVMLYNWRKKKSRKNMYMNMEQGKKYVHIQVFLDLLFVLGILLMVDLHFYTFWGFNLLILILILFFHIK